MEADRRTILRGAAGLGGAAVVGGIALFTAFDQEESANVAASGDGGSSGGGASGGDSDGDDSGSGTAGGPLGSVADVEVGGGKIFRDAKVVVTEPAKGEYKGFTAVCTHEQCIVGSVSDGVILCFCHNSQFSAADGSVVNGPATEPLAPKQIKVSGGKARLV